MIKGYSTSYGDKQDREAYNRALIAHLRSGLTQEQAEARARKVGDPGIGWCGNDLLDGKPWVALPFEDWKAKFGTKAKAHRAKVRVVIGKREVICILGDTMPHKAHIKDGGVIDLAPGAQEAFGLKAPFKVQASWEWAC